MKLKRVRIENFRCYQDIEVEFDALTTIVGKNDIGKSSILEALEIFFNNETVKIDPTDVNIHSGANKVITMTCDFCNLPDKLILDADAETNLDEEYLTIDTDTLRVRKQFDCSKSKIVETVTIIAKHPRLPEMESLLSMKENDLKKIIRANAIESSLNGNPSMRKNIWNHFNATSLLEVVEIPVTLSGTKDIWSQLQKYLPTYALFQSDRSSKDSDDEVQDPMKNAIKEALKQVDGQIEEIKKKVQEEAEKNANDTFEALKKISPDLAQQLSPKFTPPTPAKWNGLFSINMATDEGIPLNKRGSGVRRMILVSFFKAAADRRAKADDRCDVIYAIEEPETGQHPNNQKVLIDSFYELANSGNSQVILTTHSPNISKELPLESVRFVTRDADQNPLVLVCTPSNDVINQVFAALGILPDVRPHVKVVVCVEGPTDVDAMKSFNRCLHEHYHDLVDIENAPEIMIIPLGGSILKHWVDYQYLQKLHCKEFHIYDNDVATYQNTVDSINGRGDGSWAGLTKKREIENYLHQDAIYDSYGVTVETDSDGVPARFGAAYAAKMGWKGLNDNKSKIKLSSVFRNTMNYQRLVERDPDGEIKGWFDIIEGMLV
jgi:predicted ATP-dependent endonuclease of OLD family